MVLLSSIIQSPIQALLRPAMWIPGIKKLHSHKEKWHCEKTPDVIMSSILKALKHVADTDDTGTVYDIHKLSKDKRFLRVFVFTWAEWLDVIEISISENTIVAKSFSTGLVPLCVPFACILNVVLFWCPFYDNKFNKIRIQTLREAMDIDLTYHVC